MKAMSTYIASIEAADVCSIAADEIVANMKEIQYRSQRSVDSAMCLLALRQEKQCLDSTDTATPRDSVKGENAMRIVYAPYRGKAADIITLRGNGALGLAELKFALKIGGSGPFRSAQTFKEAVSDKFLEMAATLLPDGENIESLRIIAVSDIQLPFAISRVRSIQGMKPPPGLYSSDGRQYDYVLCSSKTLSAMIHNPPAAGANSSDYLFFKI